MRVLGGVCACTVALGIGAGSALAQSATTPVPAFPGQSLAPEAVGPEGSTVFNRARPDYDPLGIRYGSFIINPSVGLSETYDSNIFATPTSTQSDVYTTLRPSIAINSNWNRHALGMAASGEFKWYASHDSENVNNFATDVHGRYDIANAEYLIGDVGYSLLHEDRSSPNAAFGTHPTEYHVTGGYLGYVRNPTRLGFRLDSTITSYDYNNTSTGTGATIIQDDRDRVEYVVAPRLSYTIVDPYQVFVRVLGNMRQYNSVDAGVLAVDGVSARRNSQGWEADAGGAIEITRLITGEIYIGYLEQNFESPLFSDTSGIAGGGNVLWNVTPLTSVKASVSQSVAETTLIVGTTPASSSQETNLTLTVEHELLRNVLLLGSVGYVRDDYQGIVRTDNTYAANIGARYLWNRNWKATADLTYSSRSSSAVGVNYDRIIATIGISAGL
jgi:hypothetical protein